MPTDRSTLHRPTTIDEYLATVPQDRRAALENLRKAIRAALPKAEEGINYGIPGYRLNGKYLFGFGAAANHCAFYLGATTQRFRAALKKYDISKGTIRFQPDNPLPPRLVCKLVKARVAEKMPNESRSVQRRPVPQRR
jgi:uncharacterized protein YdhG (YjbR/CyaY superfamily)